MEYLYFRYFTSDFALISRFDGSNFLLMHVGLELHLFGFALQLILQLYDSQSFVLNGLFESIVLSLKLLQVASQVVNHLSQLGVIGVGLFQISFSLCCVRLRVLKLFL